MASVFSIFFVELFAFRWGSAKLAKLGIKAYGTKFIVLSLTSSVPLLQTHMVMALVLRVHILLMVQRRLHRGMKTTRLRVGRLHLRMPSLIMRSPK